MNFTDNCNYLYMHILGIQISKIRNLLIIKSFHMCIFIFHHYFVYLHQKIRQGSLPDGKDMEVNKHKDSLICIQAKSVM